MNWIVEGMRDRALRVGFDAESAEAVANFAFLERERGLNDAIAWLKTTSAVTLSGKGGGYEMLEGFIAHDGEP